VRIAANNLSVLLLECKDGLDEVCGRLVAVGVETYKKDFSPPPENTMLSPRMSPFASLP
jgi:hypothetical protein